MFTLEQIKTAHSKVRSGADFPAYIREIRALGVTHYEAYVTDGHMDYHAAGSGLLQAPARFAPQHIADTCQPEVFKAALAAHQQGKTDFAAFIAMCATTGIEKWAISMDQMTCTYYDKKGDEVLVEQIPE